MMRFHRYSCLNGLVIGNKLAYVYGRHTKNFDPISFGAKFKTASEYIASGETINKMRKWYKTKIKRSDISNLFCNTLTRRKEKITNKYGYNRNEQANLLNLFDIETNSLAGKGRNNNTAVEEGSLWTAYQAATHWSTHTVDSKKPHVKRVIREKKVLDMLGSDTWEYLEVAA